MKRILAISGSTKQNSTNWKIIDHIRTQFSEKMIVEFYKDLDKLPHFDPSVQEDEIPDIVKRFLTKIEKADGILICTPEYVFSLPAVLKNALEWTVSCTVLSYRPAAFIVAAGSGEFAFQSLDLIMKTLLQQSVPDGAKLLIKGAKGIVDKNGQIVHEKVLGQIEVVVKNLISSMERDTPESKL